MWCGRRDSNSHGLRHWNLNPARLPIPPLPQNDSAGGLKEARSRHLKATDFILSFPASKYINQAHHRGRGFCHKARALSTAPGRRESHAAAGEISVLRLARQTGWIECTYSPRNQPAISSAAGPGSAAYSSASSRHSDSPNPSAPLRLKQRLVSGQFFPDLKPQNVTERMFS